MNISIFFYSAVAAFIIKMKLQICFSFILFIIDQSFL